MVASVRRPPEKEKKGKEKKGKGEKGEKGKKGKKGKGHRGGRERPGRGAGGSEGRLFVAVLRLRRAGRGRCCPALSPLASPGGAIGAGGGRLAPF